ncbi:MAG: 2,3-bisphosphoglycerate-independent phosphoglycerate mutase [Candidatus Dormiibacterota bacterium]
MTPRRRAVLCILDGYGCREQTEGNAIAQASTPNFDALWAGNPHSELAASGLAVGLPEGQQGNSEVGHLTIGSGRVVLQDLTRIDAAIADGSFFQNPVLTAAADRARDRGGKLHLVGLVSPGGVHSHQEHLAALCELARRHGVGEVAVHAITDGRDTPTTAGAGYLEALEERLASIGVGRVATVSGRYYAMDRDRRWERVEPAFLTMLGVGERIVRSASEYARASYQEGVTDEFLLPAAVVPEGGASLRLDQRDVVVHFNFRPDRARELCHALVDPDFSGFPRGPWSRPLDLVTFTHYDDALTVPVAFPKPEVGNTLAEVVSRAGLGQFHVAETEKYAHVTYFINGGREEPFPLEERTLIPSSKVATYDLKPEMSADGITDAAVAELERGDSALVVLNYANADMVGHTGNLVATVAAVEYLDSCLGRLAAAAREAGCCLLITADHGNAEYLLDESGNIVTAHTTNPVPVILVGLNGELRSDGGLRDVAPTLLAAMGLEVPPEMTGRDLRGA